MNTATVVVTLIVLGIVAAGGAGIGLAIVKQFVEAQGGSVSVHSPEGGGAEFRVRLRRALS